MDRVVFLVDMNAFFISCEMSRNSELVGKPAAVAGNPKTRTGIILAANYEARKFGVKTTMVIHQALKLCPDMLLVPPEHRFYEKKSMEVMEILERFSPIIEQNSIDEAWLDMSGTETLFGSPVEAAQQIMDSINEELGLWCSIGISQNKLLSKIASEIKKPMGITELWQKDIQTKLWPLKVTDLYGIGKQTGLKLSNLGIKTISELANYNSQALVSFLGRQGLELQRMAHGIDESAVTPHVSGEMKSIGRSTTLSSDITDIDEVKTTFIEMCEEVGFEARKNNKKGRTIQITIKYSDFKTITRQTSIEPTYLTKDIYETGFSLLNKNWNSLMPVRLIGISISGFENDSLSGQMSLFDTVEFCDSSSRKEEKLEKAIDSIRSRLGTNSIGRAIQIKNPKIK